MGKVRLSKEVLNILKTICSSEPEVHQFLIEILQKEKDNKASWRYTEFYRNLIRKYVDKKGEK